MSQKRNERMPRWVKVLGIIIAVLILLGAVVLVTGIGGPHGPDRHIPSGSDRDAIYTAIVAGVTVTVRGSHERRLTRGGSG